MRKWIDLFEAAQPLPSSGQKPWWVVDLAPLTKQMKKNHDGWGWTTGGCFAFAEALHAAYGGELWAFCSEAEDMSDYDVQHGVCRIGEHCYDFNGVFDPEAYRNKLIRSRFITRKTKIEMLPADSSAGYYWMQDDFMDDKEMETLMRIMREGK